MVKKDQEPRKHSDLPKDEAASVPEQITQQLDLLVKTLESRKNSGLETILFIPVTGPEGSGKTTLLNSLSERLDRAGITTKTIKMLGGSDISNQIRTLVFSDQAANTPTTTVIHLLQAAIAAAANQVHQYAIENQGQPIIIFGDRSPFDTAVYQVMAEDSNDIRAIKLTDENLTLFLDQGVLPSVTLFIDIDPAIGLARKHAQDEVNRFELLGLEFHQKIRAGFQTIVEALQTTKEIKMLDGNMTKEQLQLATIIQINNLLDDQDNTSIIGTPILIRDAQRWVADAPDIALKILQTPIESAPDFYRVLEALDDLFLYAQNHTFSDEQAKITFAENFKNSLLGNKNLMFFLNTFSRSKEFARQLLSYLQTTDAQTFLTDDIKFVDKTRQVFYEAMTVAALFLSGSR